MRLREIEEGRRHRARDLLLLAGCVVVLVLPGIARTELTTTDEARYTEVAREMRLADHWVVPLLNGEAYWEKPALFFDLLQIPQRLTGRVTALGSRLVVLPFAIVTVWLIYAAGLLLASRRAGLYAGLTLASLPLFVEFAQYATLDMPMLACITAAIYAGLRAERSERRRGRWLLLSALLMGLGAHFKGPVSIVFTAIVLGFDACSRRGWRALLTTAIVWMPLVSISVLGIWFVPMVLDQGDAYFDYAIGRHVVDRSVGGSAPHAKGAFFYLPRWFLMTFPWCLLLPELIAAMRRDARRGSVDRSAPRGALHFPLLWALGVPLFLSLLASKRSQYLLPALPGFALAVGIWFDVRRAEVGSSPSPLLGFTRGLRPAFRTVGFVLLAATILTIPLMAGWREGLFPAETPSIVEGLVRGGTAFCGLLLGSGSLLWASRRLRPSTPSRIFVALLVVATGLAGVRHGVFDPAQDRFLRPVEFGARIRAIRAADVELGMFGLRLNGTYHLHSGETRFEPLITAEEVRTFLGDPGARAIVAKHRYFKKGEWPELENGTWEVLTDHGEGRATVCVVGNRAASERSPHRDSAD